MNEKAHPREMNQQIDVFSKRMACRIGTMIDSRLIWYKHYYPWADELITALDEPPLWLLELATIKYYPDAVAAIQRFVYSEPFQEMNLDECSDERVACLFLRYSSDAISWATFLELAGSFTDGNGGRRECEYYYNFLTELEDNEYSKELEVRQSENIESQFDDVISVIHPLYQKFIAYFRTYAAKYPACK